MRLLSSTATTERGDDDGFGKHSVSGAGRLPDPRMDHWFLMSRSPRRSLSPPWRRDSRRRRTSSLERRDLGWDVGGRGGRISSRSPPPLPLEQLRRRPGHGGSLRYEYADVNGGGGGGDNSGLRKEEFEFMRNRVVRDDLDGIVHQKLPVMDGLDDGSGRGSYRLATDVVGSTSKNNDPGVGGNISFMSSKMGLDRFKDERGHYLDPLRGEKFSLMELYDKGERPMLYTRDAPYETVAASQSKDFMMSSQSKDFPSSSSGNLRVDFPNPYWDGGPLPADDYVGGSEKIALRMGVGRYEEKHALGSGRSSEAAHKELLAYDRTEPFSPARDDRHKYMHNRSVLGERDDLGIGRAPISESKNHILYKRDTLSPPRADRRTYLYPRTGMPEASDYPSDGINRRMSELLAYDLRPKMDPMIEHYNTDEFTRRNLANSSLWDHHSPEKKPFSNHMSMTRSPIASKETERYLDSVTSHVEFRRRVSRDEEMPYLGDSKDRDIMLPMKSNYGVARDACLVYPKDRMRRSPEFHHELEMPRSPEFRRERDMRRISVRTKDVQGNEYDTYNPSSRALKRKHSNEEDINWHDSRDIMSSKWNSSSRTQDLDERDEDWFSQERYSSKRAAYDRENNRRDDRIFDRTERHRFSTYEDRSLSREPADHVLWQSRPHNSEDRYLKGNSKPGSQGWYSSYHYNRKNVLPKPNYVWIRTGDGNQRDVHKNVVEQSHNPTNSTKSKLTEDSEEFKQLVHSYFLSLTRKLNDHPAVQKRYKEQGKAGSLFCIVCGRSESKEFKDTQRLATHAFMSHKPGLRAQHLGLHKAICVLLGWNSVVSPDVVTWFPQTITNAEALAQKEDLIIWPPVFIIRNTSSSEDDSERQRGITVEAVEIFLRGKGVTGGKVKVGNDANNGSIMVVKFLGTFSGLQDAEKLQKYFSDKKRGRIHYEKIAHGKGKRIKNRDGKKGGEIDELALYGYMGISEDLDLVDYDTKRKCSIKSKKEIQDIADAPVKPE